MSKNDSHAETQNEPADEPAKQLASFFDRLGQSDEIESAELQERIEQQLPDDHRIQRIARGLAYPISDWSGDEKARPGVGTTTDTQFPRQFGKYEILRERAAGGMGVVYLARDTDLDRTVALKQMLPKAFSSPTGERRFLSEARANAAVEHPNVVQVHEVGRVDGIPYIAMQWVDSETLATHIFQNNPTPPSRENVELYTRWMQQIALATQDVHDRGLLHRDIKPANILIRQDDAFPLLADFGLAKRLDETSGLTREGHVVGSANYIPPEHLTNGSQAATHLSDVYGLGITLYAALTGSIPFPGSTWTEILDQVKSSTPKPIAELNSAVPRDLAIVCEKAIEKDPADRYPSVKDFADDLNAALNGFSIKARPIGRTGRVMRWSKRNPRRASLLAATLCLLACSLAWYMRRPAHLSLTVSPAEAIVSVDGQTVRLIDGKGELTTAPGTHQVTARLPGYESQSAEVALSRGRENVVAQTIRLVRLKGAVRLNTVPENAIATVMDEAGNKIAAGRTPVTLSELPSGEATLAIAKPLFNDWKQSLEIPKGNQTLALPKIELQPRYDKQFGSSYLGEAMRSLAQPFDHPVKAINQTVSELADLTSEACGAPVVVDTISLAKMGYPKTASLTLQFDSIGSLVQNLDFRDTGLSIACQFNEDSPVWMLTTRIDAGRRLLRGIYSLEELSISIPPAQIARMIAIECDPAAWQFLGGVSTASPIPGANAITVSAPLRVHQQVTEYLQGLSDLAEKDADRNFEEKDLWTSQFTIGETRKLNKQSNIRFGDQLGTFVTGETNVCDFLFLNEDQLLIATGAGEIQLWSLNNKQQVRTYTTTDRPRRVNCLIRLGDRNQDDDVQFAAGDGRGNVWIFNAKSSKSIKGQNRHLGDVTGLAVSSDQSRLYSVGADGFVCQFEMPEFKLHKFARRYDKINDVLAFGNDAVIVHEQSNDRLTLLDTAELSMMDQADTGDLIGKLLTVQKGDDSSHHFLVAGQRLSQWELKRKKLVLISQCPDPPSPIWGAAWNRHLNQVATLHRDGQAVLRDTATLRSQAAVRPSISFGGLPLAISPSGTKIAIAGWVFREKKWQSTVFLQAIESPPAENN